MDSKEFAAKYLDQCLETLKSLPLDEIAEMIDTLDQARKRGSQVFLCGNGGSAGTASHMANDLGKGSSAIPDGKRFRVISLVDNIPWITALANDLDYSEVFQEQLKNLAQAGDILVAISGSGNSPNVIKAVQWSNDNGLTTIGLTGVPGGKLVNLCRFPIQVNSSHMGQIEDGHFLIQHLVGYFFMEELSKSAKE